MDMTIRTLEIAGLVGTLSALRLPFGKECRSDVEFNNSALNRSYFTESSVCIDERDLVLMSTLVKRGDEHAKAIRGIMVWAEIDAPIYFYRELETYRAGRERLSCNSTMHQQCKGLSGEELVKAKAEMPMGTMQKTVDVYSYQCLRNIVRQRHNHRLPEWKVFVDWVRTLPFAKELIFRGLDIDLDDDKED